MEPLFQTASSPLPRCGLVVGHPGHELKVFGWISEYKPRVYVISDGSGRQGVSRTTSTSALLMQLGCEAGEIFGSISDAGIYRAILEGNHSLFVYLVDQIADSFSTHKIDMVAGDAAEGFNPTHDLCRAVINAAVLKAQRQTGKAIHNLEFTLTEWERNAPEQEHDHRCRHFTLNDSLLEAKISAAEGYVELKDEVHKALAHRGQEYFRVECLRAASSDELLPQAGCTKPLYETWGEQRVESGEYRTVIRLKEHILPIMTAVRDHALNSNVEMTVR